MDKLHHRVLGLVAVMIGMLVPAWGDEYEISGVLYGTPVISVKGGSSFVNQPIFLAFRSGDLFWNRNYFEDNKLIGALDPLFSYHVLVIMEGQERIGAGEQVLEQTDTVDEEYDSAKPPPRVPQLFPRDKDPYIHGTVDPEVIARFLRDAEEGGYFYKDIPPLRANSWITVRIVHDGVSRRVRGPFGYWYDPSAHSQYIAPWDSHGMPREQWRAFIGSILAFANVASPTGELPDFQDLVVHKHHLPKALRGDVDLPSPTVGEAEVSTNGVDAPLSSEASAILTEAKALWQNDRQVEAISLLKNEAENHGGIDRATMENQLGYYAIATEDRKLARRSFLRARREARKIGHPLAGEAAVQLGHMALRDYFRDEVMQFFSSVASGEIPATASTLEESQFRTAALLRSSRSSTHGIIEKIYRDLSKSALTEEKRLEATMQVAAYVLERAKGDYGDVSAEVKEELLEETRALTKKVASSEEASDASKVTAEVMHLQTQYYSAAHEELLVELEQFDNKWTTWKDLNPDDTSANVDTHLVTAMTFGLFSAFHVGDYEKVIQLSDEITSRFEESDQYRSFNSFAYALLYKGFAHEKLGDREKALTLLATCREQYPNWFKRCYHREAWKAGIKMY